MAHRSAESTVGAIAGRLRSRPGRAVAAGAAAVGVLALGAVLAPSASSGASTESLRPYFVELIHTNTAASAYRHTRDGSAKGISIEALELTGYVPNAAWNTEVVGSGTYYCVETANASTPTTVYHHSNDPADDQRADARVFPQNGFVMLAGPCPAT